MAQFMTWLGSHKPSTHVIASVLLFLIGAYSSVPAFHKVVADLATAHPNIAEYATAGAGLFLLYWTSRKGA